MPALPFQFVCVAGPSDLPLARSALASLALAVDRAGHAGVAWVFVDDSDTDRFQRLVAALPRTTALEFRILGKSVFREHLSGVGYTDQMRIKLLASTLVESQYYNVVDADFLFTAPLQPADLFRDGRGIYRIGPWHEDAEATHKWRRSSEAVLAGPVDFCGMIAPPYLLCRDVARSLVTSPEFFGRFKDQQGRASEYVTYAAYAFAHARQAHEWVTEPWPGELVLLNQRDMGGSVHLDETIRLENFPARPGIVFWSHWDEAEPLMRKFCLQLHEMHGREAPGLLEPFCRDIEWSTFQRDGLRAVHAAWSDGWAHGKAVFELTNIPFGTVSASFDVVADWPNTLDVVTASRQRSIPIPSGRSTVTLGLPFGRRRTGRIGLRFRESRKESATGRNLYLRLA